MSDERGVVIWTDDGYEDFPLEAFRRLRNEGNVPPAAFVRWSNEKTWHKVGEFDDTASRCAVEAPIASVAMAPAAAPPVLPSAQPVPYALQVPVLNAGTLNVGEIRPARSGLGFFGWIGLLTVIGMAGIFGLFLIGAALSGGSPGTTSGAAAGPSVELETWQFEGRKLVGTVKNVSGRNLRFVSIQFELLDTAGNKVGTASDTLSGLSAGQTWRFSAYAWEETAAGARVQELWAR